MKIKNDMMAIDLFLCLILSKIPYNEKVIVTKTTKNGI